MYISTYISSSTFAWSSKLTVDIDSMGPDLQLLGGHFSNFILGKVSTEFKLHGMSIFHDIQMATYFGTGWCYSHMVGYAGSPTYTAYVDMTLTRFKVKVKVTGLLNFRQPAKPCMLAAMTAAPLRGFLVVKCALNVPVLCPWLYGNMCWYFIKHYDFFARKSSRCEWWRHFGHYKHRCSYYCLYRLTFLKELFH